MRPAGFGETCRNYRPRPAEPEGDVKRIPLGDGVYAYVDAADYEWLSRDTWHVHNGYAARWHKNKRIYMHREIMQPPPGKIVDHMNHNKLDNTRANLRVCTPAENQRNQRKQHGTASIYKGVAYSKKHRKWTATIGLHRKYTQLGYYDTEIEAARAYDRAAVERFGEFANLNFPEEWPPQRRQELCAQRDAAKTEDKKVGRTDGRKASPRAKRQAGVKKTKPPCAPQSV